jgi:hypothetical protein
LINVDDNNAAIGELYSTLESNGVVSSIKEFNKDWLNRSEGYLRYLRLNKKQASVDALAICSSKLKHYCRLMRMSKQTKFNTLIQTFEMHTNRFDNMIMQQSEIKWIDKMKADEKETMH